MVAHDKVIVVRSHHRNRFVGIAEHDRRVAGQRWRDKHSGHIALDGLHILQLKGLGQRAHPAKAACGRTGHDEQQVRADTRNLVGHTLRSGLAKVNHDHDAADANDDAEGGQKRTQLVPDNRLKGHHQGVQPVHDRISDGGPSLTSRPSTKYRTRSA